MLMTWAPVDGEESSSDDVLIGGPIVVVGEDDLPLFGELTAEVKGRVLVLPDFIDEVVVRSKEVCLCSKTFGGCAHPIHLGSEDTDEEETDVPTHHGNGKHMTKS